MWVRNRHLATGFAALLCACAAGPDYVRPDPPTIHDYLPTTDHPIRMEALGQVQQWSERQSLAADWWRLFQSSAVDSLVDEALRTNPGVQSAQATLRASQDELRAGYGVFFPQLDVSYGATRERLTPARLGLAGAGGIFNLFSLGSTISYALDLFGGSRRQVEALRATVDYQRYNLLATDLSLTGNVINTAIAREAYAEEMAVTQELILLQRNQLSVTQTRVSAGTEPYSALASVRSALASTEATLPALEQHRDQADHALSVLLGRPTGQADAPGFRLTELHLPAELPLSLPSSLVRQRPDILMAEAQLHAANAEVGVATAALFPTFELSGGYGGESNTTGALGSAQNRFWSGGVTADWEAFQGGTRWFQRKASQENYLHDTALYRQTVLAAFAQVADTLKALQHDAQGLADQDEAARASKDALDLVKVNYSAGVAGYLDVLAADQQYQQARLAYVQSQAQRLQDTVALYVALGGGWWNAPQNRAPVHGDPP
jgi:NodT family efflux transporter outer membrane factor (OMF) lipoprotein